MTISNLNAIRTEGTRSENVPFIIINAIFQAGILIRFDDLEIGMIRITIDLVVFKISMVSVFLSDQQPVCR